MSEREEWVRSQMVAAGIDQVCQTSVRRLLDVWDTMTFADDDPRISVVLDAFTALAQSHALRPMSEATVTWMPARVSKPKQHDQVRVALDAFSGPLGLDLNGREGTVARITHGLYVVAFSDGSSRHLSPDLLETRGA